jgi:hypothetical protein
MARPAAGSYAADCHVFFDPDQGHQFFRRRLREMLAVPIGRRGAR